MQTLSETGRFRWSILKAYYDYYSNEPARDVKCGAKLNSVFAHTLTEIEYGVFSYFKGV